MKRTASILIFGLSCTALFLALLIGFFWWSIVIDHDGRGSLGFRYLFAPIFGGGFFALAICGALLYRREHQRRDLWSLALAGISGLTVLAEATALFFVPLHGPW